MNAFSFIQSPTSLARSPGDVALALLARLGAGVGSIMVLAACALWLRNGATVDWADTLGTLGDLLMALACCVVAGLILGRRPRHRIGWLLLAIGLLWATEWFGEAYSRYAYLTLGRELPGAAFLLWLSSLTWVPGFGLVIWLILLFPDGRLLSPRWRWVGLAATLLTLPTTLLVGAFAWSLAGPDLWAFLYSEQMPPLDAGQQRLLALFAGPIGVTVPLAFLLLLPAETALFWRLQRAQGVERQQVKWFAYAVLLLTITMTFFVLIQLWGTQTGAELTALSVLWELLYIVAPAFLPVAIGIAILRHRLWDIDLIIRRTLVYTLLTSLVIGVYSELTGQVQETIADVRRLIYNLRPPALDDLGLLAALQQVAAHSSPTRQIIVEAPPGLPALPAAASTAAAYRIVQEALTNVTRRAEAQHCVVRVDYGVPTDERAPMAASAADALLTVEICDDGVGLPAQRQAGVGTSSMRERAEVATGVGNGVWQACASKKDFCPKERKAHRALCWKTWRTLRSLR